MKNYFFTLLLGLSTWSLQAQNPQELLINQGGAVGASNFVELGDFIYFNANNGSNGNELWRSNGTNTGTSLVRDINAGTASALPGNFIAYGNQILFAATTADNGRELWKSNGTEAGTLLVKDIHSGASNSNPSNLLLFNNLVFFTANDGTNTRLFKSDGTEAGTVAVGTLGFTTIRGLVIYNAQLYFAANSSSPNRFNLYRSNGSDIEVVWEDASNDLNINNLTVAGSLLYFTATSVAEGQELHSFNGTDVALVRDIQPGSTGSSLANLTAFGTNLFFVANDGSNGTELWKSDGTEAGTVLVKDIQPGTGNSSPAQLTVFQNTLYFSADNGSIGRELWKSDGTEAGTVLVIDINTTTPTSSATPNNLTPTPQGLFFAANNAGTGAAGRTELWRTDGTEAGTVRITTLNTSANASVGNINYHTSNLQLFFTATGQGSSSQLWVYTIPGARLRVQRGSELLANNSSLVFEDRNVGQVQDISLSFTNIGNQALDISTLNLSGEGFSIQGTPFSSIAAGASATLLLRFAPGSAGDKTAAFRLQSNALNLPDFQLALEGTALAPTSLSDAIALGYLVYPNPAQENLALRAPQAKRWTYALYNLQGGLLLQAEADAQEVRIPLADKQAGLYLLKVQQDGRIAQIKIIKQ